MKTLSTAVLIGLSLGFLNTAAAEPFNERGIDWRQQLTPSNQAGASLEVAYPMGFNDRGGNRVVTASPQSGSAECTGDQSVAQVSGFKQKNSTGWQNGTETRDEWVAQSSSNRRDEQC
jgi:hypothetical protein